jgi:nitrogen fixation NifU-like protein
LDSRFPELDALYREVVLDHFRKPRGKKTLPDPDVENQGLNPVCGDEVRVALKMKDGHICDAAIQSRGCAISVASGSMLAELLIGKTGPEVERLLEAFRGMLHGREVPDGVELGDLEALEGVRHLPVRVKCALLAWTTLRDALHAWEESGVHRPASPSSTEHQDSDFPPLPPRGGDNDFPPRPPRGGDSDFPPRPPRGGED